MKASIDQLVGKLERQIKQTREKTRSRRKVKATVPAVETPDEDGQSPIVRTKHFALKPMPPEEAVLQLELLGHDFYVFRSIESGEVNVVYRRNAG